jgi:beta-lactamase class A
MQQPMTRHSRITILILCTAIVSGCDKPSSNNTNSPATQVIAPVVVPVTPTPTAPTTTNTSANSTQMPQTSISASSKPAKTVTLEPDSSAHVTPSGCALPPQTTKLTPPAIPKQITGRLGLYVARVPSGTKEFAPIKVIEINPQGQFPLASNFKQSVLLEVLRQVDQGYIKLSEKFKVTRGSQSYGRYPYDGTDVMGLALAMIGWSDNTATDMLFRRVGIGSVQPIMNELRLCNTRVLLPTKAWWTAQAGLGGKDFPKYSLVKATQKFAKYPLEAQLKIAARLDANAQNTNPETLRRYLDNGYFAGRNGGVDTMSSIDRNIQNASTPAEWARFIHHEFVNSDLSNSSRKLFRDTMYHGKGRAFIHVPIKYFGGKSGNTARVLTYSGYLETNSGDRIIYVYFNDASQNLITRDETPQAFYLINAAIRKVMRPEDLKPIKKPTPKQPITTRVITKANARIKNLGN